MQRKLSLGIQADLRSRHGSGFRSFIKKQKNRKERRRSNRNPLTPPTYGRYRGWYS